MVVIADNIETDFMSLKKKKDEVPDEHERKVVMEPDVSWVARFKKVGTNQVGTGWAKGRS